MTDANLDDLPTVSMSPPPVALSYIRFCEMRGEAPDPAIDPAEMVHVVNGEARLADFCVAAGCPFH